MFDEKDWVRYHIKFFRIVSALWRDEYAKFLRESEMKFYHKFDFTIDAYTAIILPLEDSRERGGSRTSNINR